MTVSIIICTRNGADRLGRALKTIEQAVIPEGWTVEILVVDNGSTDRTPEIVNQAATSKFVLRYLSEPRAGQCYARNTGVDEARGEVILFTDDDVLVPVGWIEGMCRPMINGEADAIAGRVVFPREIDDKLRSNSLDIRRRSWLASTEEVDPHRPTRMVGANMAFHRRVPDSGLRFDVELGPGALGFGDETLFSWMLLDEGFRLMGAPNVLVEHSFDTSRLSNEYVQALAKRMGESQGYLAWHWQQQDASGAMRRLLWMRIKFALWKMLAAFWRSKAMREERKLWYLQHIALLERFLKESHRTRKYSPRSVASPYAVD